MLNLLDDRNITIDHLTPYNKGGTNDIENLVLCCRSCNSTKGNKTEKQFKEWKRIKSSKEYHDFLRTKQYYQQLFQSLNSDEV